MLVGESSTYSNLSTSPFGRDDRATIHQFTPTPIWGGVSGQWFRIGLYFCCYFGRLLDTQTILLEPRTRKSRVKVCHRLFVLLKLKRALDHFGWCPGRGITFEPNMLQIPSHFIWIPNGGSNLHLTATL